jgi:hypothetical protein
VWRDDSDEAIQVIEPFEFAAEKNAEFGPSPIPMDQFVMEADRRPLEGNSEP